MKPLENINVGDKIGVLTSEGLYGRHPRGTESRNFIEPWVVIAITKTTVRARRNGLASSWSFNGRPVGYGVSGGAVPWTPEIEAVEAAKRARWEKEDQEKLSKARLQQSISDSIEAIRRRSAFMTGEQVERLKEFVISISKDGE